MQNIFFFLVISFLAISSAMAESSPSESKEESSERKADSIFGEDGSYNVSVDGAGVSVHQEFDKDGKPKSGKGTSGAQAIESVDRDFHKQRKLDRRKRKAERRDAKKKAKELR